MAFNWQTFRTRALSAIVFVAIMAVGLFWSQWSFLILFTIVHFGCWFEYFRLVKAIKPEDETAANYIAWLFMLLGWGVYLSFCRLDIEAWQITVARIGWVVVCTAGIGILLAALFYNKKITGRLVLAMAAGVLYISLPLGLLLYLRTHWGETAHPFALVLPLLIIYNNWINDTMAYIVGSLIGKTPFSPISPKKTWEGTIGGVVLSVAAMSLIAYFTGLLPAGHAAALAFIGAVSGTYGDLFESKLKRMAGVKDSGSMMPGHGGFLDRFDSLLFSATACTIYVAAVMLS